MVGIKLFIVLSIFSNTLLGEVIDLKMLSTSDKEFATCTHNLLDIGRDLMDISKSFDDKEA